MQPITKADLDSQLAALKADFKTWFAGAMPVQTVVVLTGIYLLLRSLHHS